MSGAPVQLLAWEFGPDASYEGLLVGALERLESGGALRVIDLVLVHRDPVSGELEALELGSDVGGGITGPLVDFRLAVRSRARETERALAGARGAELLALGERLAPGGAIAAVFVEHRWAETLADAVRRVGGTQVVDEIVDDDEIARRLA